MPTQSRGPWHPASKVARFPAICAAGPSSPIPPSVNPQLTAARQTVESRLNRNELSAPKGDIPGMFHFSGPVKGSCQLFLAPTVERAIADHVAQMEKEGGTAR